MAHRTPFREGFAGAPVLGSGRAGLRIELVLEDAGAPDAPEPLEEGSGPFVCLDDSGRWATVLLGRVVLGKGTTIRPLALKIQRSAYRSPQPGLDRERVTNVDVDEAWRGERDMHLALQESSPLEAASLLDLGEEFFRNGPITFCRKTRGYFHPPCPACAGPLEDCRDDGLLSDLGLPPYSESLTRFLHCPACTAPSSPSPAPARVFYTYSLGAEGRPRSGVAVRRRGELYRDLADLVRKDLPAPERERLGERFPCSTCEHRDGCYPPDAGSGPIPAESLLVPISYHEFHLLPLETLELHIDELGDLLGGAPWARVKKVAVEAGSPGRARLLDPLEGAFSSPFQWIHEHEVSGAFSLEVLRLKLIAFTQLARGLRTFHAVCRRPHLAVSPASAMATIRPPGPDLPVRWSFQVKLTELGAARRLLPASAGGNTPRNLLVPPADMPKGYASPDVRPEALVGEEAMRVTMESAEAEGGHVRLEGEAVSSRASLREHSPGDALRIAPSTPLAWLGEEALWGVLGERTAGGFRFTARAPAGTRVEAKSGFAASVGLFRRLHTPCDLHGLGMLLFRLLLVNDTRDFFAVEEAVRRVLSKLADSSADLADGSGRSPAGLPSIAGLLEPLLEDEDQVFDPSSIAFLRADREERVNGIPPRLWSDILLFAFRLVTSIPGFSFRGRHTDREDDRPEAAMDEVLLELEEIEARTHIELFGRAERAREIREACEGLIAEITGTHLGPGPAGRAPPS